MTKKKEQLFERVAVFTDIHWGLKHNSRQHNDDCERFVQWFIDEAKQRGCETCIFMGDWHHHRASVNVSTLNYTLSNLGFLDDAFDKTYFIVGNHDLYYREKREINSLPMAERFPNIVMIDRIYEEGNVAVVPWLVGDEWKKIDKKTKQPHHITVQGADAFGLAGLWERWQDSDGNELQTMAILTCAPNEMMADLHDRMPVILPAETYDAWLDADQQDAAKAARMLKPYPAERMAAWPVSTYVNKAGHEGERCIEPVGQQGLFG